MSRFLYFPYHKTVGLISLLLVFILTGCSKDDDGGDNNFYSDALKSATASNLEGTWSIFEVEFEGERTAVPPTTQNCGRDFFNFRAGNRYSEYLFRSSSCLPDTNNYSSELVNGVVTLTNQFGQKEELVLIELTSEKLSFKARFDVDEDGSLDVLIFYAKKYEPPVEMDLYSSTFIHDWVIDHLDKIRLSWLPYGGFNEFSRYEIFRSAGNCDKNSAELIATLDVQEIEFFIDENPVASENLCYYFKVYTDKGLLGESELVSVDTGSLKVSPVMVSEPIVGSESIELNWAKYSGRYFSHYEITARNYQGGSGSGYQEVAIASIENIDTYNYIDNTPPYFSNPVYTVYVVDIFGNRSLSTIEGEHNWRVNFRRPELLELDYIRKLAIDPEESIIYLYGQETATQELTIIRYNYNTNFIEAKSDIPPTSHSDIDMKVIRSDEGKEILFAQGSDINVYNAATLEYKYNMRMVGHSVFFNDFDYLRDNFWVFTDGDEIYTSTRNGAELNLVDREVHFTEHQSSNNYQIIKLDNDQILIGHSNEASSLRFAIDLNGSLTERTQVALSIKSDWKKETFFNAPQNYIINLVEGRLYSMADFSILDTFSEPNFAYGINKDGNLILGSKNDPDEEVNHEKKVYIYNRALQTIEEYETNGYPHFVFENHLDQIISISSGLLRPELDRPSPEPDIFIEIVQ